MYKHKCIMHIYMYICIYMQCYYVAPLQPPPISRASLYEIINVQIDIYVCICVYVLCIYIYMHMYMYAMLLCGFTTASTYIKGFTVKIKDCINWHKYMYMCVCIMHIYIYIYTYVYVCNVTMWYHYSHYPHQGLHYMK
jgi:hypothetical protein